MNTTVIGPPPIAEADGSPLAPTDRWVLAAILWAVCLDLIHLGTAPLWFDEIATAQWIALSWRDLLPAVLSDNHVPLYPVLIKAWSAWFGTSNQALRFPGIPWHALTVWCVAQLTHLMAGRRACRAAAFVTALAPFLLHHAQEARMYTQMAALAAISLLLVARFLTGRSRSLGFGYVLACLGMLATHYYGMFTVGAEVLAVLLVRPSAPRRYLPALAAVCAACCVAAAGAVLLARHEAGSSYHFGALALAGMGWTLVGGYTLVPDSETLHRLGWPAAVHYLPVALPAAIASVILITAAARSAERRILLLTGCVVGLVIVGPYAISLVMPGIGINPRYAASAAPALYALLAGGLMHRARPGWHNWARHAAGAVMLSTMMLGDFRELTQPGRTREDVAAAGMWLDRNVPSATPLLVTSNEMAVLARFHWPARTVVEYPARSVVVDATNAATVVSGMPLPAGNGPWYYVMGRTWLSDPDGDLLRTLSAAYALCPGTEERGIRIVCLALRAVPSPATAAPGAVPAAVR